MTTPRPRARSGLTRLLTDNLALKAMSIGLSILLFALVHSDVDAQRAIYLDVVALLPPPSSGQMLISELPAQLKVTLRGSRSKLSTLSRDQMLPVQLDLRHASSGTYYIDPHTIDVGSNIQVVEIAPSVVPLTWVAAAEKRVSVQVELEGELDSGYSLRGEAQAEPSFVTLRGPQKRLESLDTVSTDPVTLLNLRPGNHRRRVSLMALPEHVTYVEDTSVEVKLTVVPRLAERSFKRIPIAVAGDARMLPRPDHAEVTLRGPRQVLDEIEPDLIVPYVDAPVGSTEPGSTVEVSLRGVPDGVEIVRVLPASVLLWSKVKR
ncbi:MAG: YbbR-like domain-containing protein [Polyangiales bacterium]